MSSESKNIFASYLRNFVFGVEDSLVSTVGLLSGVAIAGIQRKEIFVTGIVLIFVEAFSMAVGVFLSENSAKEYLRQTEVSSSHSVKNGLIMFVSYFISGMVPLFPYIVLPIAIAFWYSIGASLAALFLLGVIGGKISRINIFSTGIKTLFIGGVAVAVGVIVGKIAA